MTLETAVEITGMAKPGIPIEKPEKKKIPDIPDPFPERTPIPAAPVRTPPEPVPVQQ